jgi:hypothetical protein
LVFLGGIAKVNSILAMVLRNANQTFLTPLPVMDLKSPHLVIALRNANNSLLPELDQSITSMAMTLYILSSMNYTNY